MDTDTDGVAGCELCEAARITPWHHDDDVCWVADCEACDVPMVVWKRHGTDPSDDVRDHMLAALDVVARACIGDGDYRLDAVRRQVPDHWHAHARDLRRWRRGIPGRSG